MRTLKKIALLGTTLATVAVIICALARGAGALPSQEVETVYFSDATYTVEIGSYFLSCNGTHARTGRTSRYVVRASSPCTTHGSNQIICMLDGVLTSCPPSICDSGLFDCN